MHKRKREEPNGTKIPLEIWSIIFELCYLLQDLNNLKKLLSISKWLRNIVLSYLRNNIDSIISKTQDKTIAYLMDIAKKFPLDDGVCSFMIGTNYNGDKTIRLDLRGHVSGNPDIHRKELCVYNRLCDDDIPDTELDLISVAGGDGKRVVGYFYSDIFPILERVMRFMLKQIPFIVLASGRGKYLFQDKYRIGNGELSTFHTSLMMSENGFNDKLTPFLKIIGIL